MFKLHTLASVLIAGSLISAPVLAQQGKTFAKVNGQPISQNVFDAFIAEQKAQGAPDNAELKAAVKELHGAYGLAVISAKQPDRLLAARSGSPLVIGLGLGENLLQA